MADAKHILFDEVGSPRYQGLIFDFDGTLADSMGVWDWVDLEFLRRRNLPLTREYTATLSTLGFVSAADYVIDLFGLDEDPNDIMDEWNDLALERYSTAVQFRPGSVAFIEVMREAGVKTGIATTLSPVLLNAVLANTGHADLFDAFATGYDVEHDKNEPDVYLLAAERIGVAPEKCCVFEDIVPGIASAKSVGMGTIAIYSGHVAQDIPLLKEIADAYIEEFTELL